MGTVLKKRIKKLLKNCFYSNLFSSTEERVKNLNPEWQKNKVPQNKIQTNKLGALAKYLKFKGNPKPLEAK